MSKHEATLIIEKSSKIDYKKVLGSVMEHKRSGIEIKETGAELIIKITTKDLTALRASVNAIMRDIQTVENTISSSK